MHSADYLQFRRGYTHYWAVSSEPETKQWTAFMAQTKKLLSHFSHLLLEESVNLTHFGENRAVEFVAVAADDYGKFTFTHKPQSFAYCRTNFNPFDALVTAVLLAAKRNIPQTTLTSDGTWDLWELGRIACREVLSYEDDDFCGAQLDFESYWSDNG